MEWLTNQNWSVSGAFMVASIVTLVCNLMPRKWLWGVGLVVLGILGLMYAAGAWRPNWDSNWETVVGTLTGVLFTIVTMKAETIQAAWSGKTEKPK